MSGSRSESVVGPFSLGDVCLGFFAPIIESHRSGCSANCEIQSELERVDPNADQRPWMAWDCGCRLIKMDSWVIDATMGPSRISHHPLGEYGSNGTGSIARLCQEDILKAVLDARP